MCTRLLLVSMAVLALAGLAGAQLPEGIPFDPKPDAFAPSAEWDLRDLNETTAGMNGWLKVDGEGGFLTGDDKPIRFWAVNTGVSRRDPKQDIARHARWLAKRGVNVVRLHAHINPDLKKTPKAKLTDVNQAELEWIWRTVGAMKNQGVYTVVSPYWANTMQSNDAAWGTDWNGAHHNLLFFDEKLQAAYKQWLRKLFKTPTKYLGGKTLAEEPALAIFQIQNEDSLLFWTFNALKGAPRQRLEAKWTAWVVQKYGSIPSAYKAWGSRKLKEDSAERLALQNIWMFTQGARKQNIQSTARLADQLEFLSRTMYDWNKEVARYVREDLGCPVLINAGNWRPADVPLMNDAERWSYTANEVLAANRYFTGLHKGKHQGWAIVNGDVYTNRSALTPEGAVAFPLCIRQAMDKPMMVTESSWVFPNETAVEGPLLISAYSSLLGIDAYFWFATGDVEYTQPGSANGYLPSAKKWIFATPDVAGQFPAAALTFRKGYIRQAKPFVTERRPLQAVWTQTPTAVTEEGGYDPNRDAGDGPKPSRNVFRIAPWAFFVGPVVVDYAAKAERTLTPPDVGMFWTGTAGRPRIPSRTSDLALDTSDHTFTVNAPRCEAVAVLAGRKEPFRLANARITIGGGQTTVMIVPLDDQPLKESKKLLVQVATPARPAGWKTKPARGKDIPEGAKEVVDYGKAPWMRQPADVTVTLTNPNVTKALVLDANGMAVRTVGLTVDGDEKTLAVPPEAMYVVLK